MENKITEEISENLSQNQEILHPSQSDSVLENTSNVQTPIDSNDRFKLEPKMEIKNEIPSSTNDQLSSNITEPNQVPFEYYNNSQNNPSMNNIPLYSNIPSSSSNTQHNINDPNTNKNTSLGMQHSSIHNRISNSDDDSHNMNNMHDGKEDHLAEIREQDRFLPIANIARIMKTILPNNAKIAKDAKESIQECVSEFISFITSEASDKCQHEKRKTINGDDLLWAMSTLGFDNYIEPLKMYLTKYREAVKPDKKYNTTSPMPPITATSMGPISTSLGHQSMMGNGSLGMESFNYSSSYNNMNNKPGNPQMILNAASVINQHPPPLEYATVATIPPPLPQTAAISYAAQQQMNQQQQRQQQYNSNNFNSQLQLGKRSNLNTSPQISAIKKLEADAPLHSYPVVPSDNPGGAPNEPKNNLSSDPDLKKQKLN